MDKERYDDRDWRATWDRLSERYSIDLASPGPLDRLCSAVSQHTRYAERGGDEYTTMTPAGEIHYRLLDQTFPKPTRQDLLDGLSLVDQDRYIAERSELALIDAAVAADVGWQQIGVALGHTAETATQAAQVRRTYLRRRIKEYERR